MPSLSSDLARSKPAILLVEPNRFLSEMMCQWMRRSDYQVHAAGNTREAMSALDIQRFDLVLLNLDLDRGDGVSLLSSVQSKLSGAPLVLLTGAVNYDDVLARISAGAPCVKIEKPYSFFALGLVMQSVLARSQPGSDGSGPRRGACC